MNSEEIKQFLTTTAELHQYMVGMFGDLSQADETMIRNTAARKDKWKRTAKRKLGTHRREFSPFFPDVLRTDDWESVQLTDDHLVREFRLDPPEPDGWDEDTFEFLILTDPDDSRILGVEFVGD